MSAEMTYSHLGRSGLQVSRAGLGTMRFGCFTADEPASFAIMDAAIGAGVNFFDTADVYGGPQSPDNQALRRRQRDWNPDGGSFAN